jgi:hypothetical protein
MMPAFTVYRTKRYAHTYQVPNKHTYIVVECRSIVQWIKGAMNVCICICICICRCRCIDRQIDMYECMYACLSVYEWIHLGMYWTLAYVLLFLWGFVGKAWKSTRRINVTWQLEVGFVLHVNGWLVSDAMERCMYVARPPMLCRWKPQ